MRGAALAMAVGAGLSIALADHPAHAAERVVAPDVVAELADDKSVRRWMRGGVLFAIAQTRDGWLWIGSQTGLERFDGRRFLPAPAKVARAIDHAPVRRLLGTRDGELWVSTGASFVQGAAGELRTTRVVGPANVVRVDANGEAHVVTYRGRAIDAFAFAEGADGTIWIGSSDGMLEARAGETTGQPLLAGELVLALLATSGGELWAGSGKTLARFATAGGPRELWRRPWPGGVSALANTRHGVVVAGAAGLSRVQSDGAVAATVKLELDASEVVTSLQELDGALWASSADGVFVVSGPGLAVRPAKELGEHEGGRVTQSFVDREGSLWLAHREGDLVQLAPSLALNLGSARDGVGPTGFSVLAVGDDVWMTHVDGLTRARGTRLATWKSGAALDVYSLRALAASRDGRVFAACNRGVLEAVADGDDGIRVAVHGPRGGGGDWPTALLATRAGDLWVAWHGGALERYGGARLDAAPVTRAGLDGDCRGVPMRAAEDVDGTVWFATTDESGAGALARIDASGPTCVLGRGSAAITALSPARRGGLWLGGQGEEPLRFRSREGRTVKADLSPWLASGAVFGLAADPDGWTWLATNAGVLRIRTEALERSSEAGGTLEAADVERFGLADGLAAEEATSDFPPNVVVDASRRAWLANLRGVSIVMPPERRPPPRLDVLVGDVTIDGVAVPDATKPLRFTEGRHDVALSLFAPTFSAPQRLTLQCRLQGLPAPWRSCLDDVTHLPDLPSGTYELQVRATVDGVFADRVAMFLVVDPPLHRRPAVVAAALGLLGLAAFGGHKVHLRRLRLAHAAVLAERGRIARDLHDGLAQKLTALGMVIDSLRSGPRTESDAGLASALGRARSIVADTHVELRRSIWDLRDANVEAQPLDERLARVVAEAARTAPIPIAFASSERRVRLPGDVNHEVPAIVQEALSNALRHARATHIDVDLIVDVDGVQILVRDDGIGFAMTPSRIGSSGFGLVSMHERARRINAELSIASTPGQGTQLSLIVPRMAKGAPA